jgi:hypothetical protein
MLLLLALACAPHHAPLDALAEGVGAPDARFTVSFDLIEGVRQAREEPAQSLEYLRNLRSRSG